MSRKNIDIPKLQWMICFSGFLDLFGVAILFPLLIHRAKDLGATPGQVGLFASIYGTLQFFTSPLMGQLSDHIGRKTVLLLSLFGTAFGYFCIGIANSITLLALARIPSGIFKHSLSVNRLILSDITSDQYRASSLGMFNSLSCFGFILGPTIGGLLSTTKYGFFKCASVASILFVMNACFVYYIISDKEEDAIPEKKNQQDIYAGFAESMPRKDHLPNIVTDTLQRRFSVRIKQCLQSLDLFKDVSVIPWSLVWDVFTVRFLLSCAVITFRSTFTSILVYKFSTSPSTNGYILSFNGIISAVSGLAVRWISPSFKTNASLHNTSAVVLLISFIAITFIDSLLGVVLTLIPLCLSTSVLRVTNIIHMYDKGGENAKGLLSGFRDTVTSLARICGPLLAGYALEYSLFGPGLCSILLATFGIIAGFHIKPEKKHKD